MVTGPFPMSSQGLLGCGGEGLPGFGDEGFARRSLGDLAVRLALCTCCAHWRRLGLRVTVNTQSTLSQHSVNTTVNTTVNTANVLQKTTPPQFGLITVKKS